MRIKYMISLFFFLHIGSVTTPLIAQKTHNNQSAQGIFDQASIAVQMKEWPKALALYDHLEARQSITDKNIRAVISLRKGEVLIKLKRFFDAQESLAFGLSNIDKTNPVMAGDIVMANKRLGQLALADINYVGAEVYYREALRFAATDEQKISIFLDLTPILIFLDTQEALKTIEAAKRLYDNSAKSEKKVIADLELLHGRVLMNLGQTKQARTHMLKAIENLGGLTTRVTLSDIEARSDVAMLAGVTGMRTELIRYLSYTGAGRFDGSEFLRTKDTDLPICNPVEGINPQDVTVVEFGIHNDGTVSYARPVYSSGPQKAALLFARAVKYWSWTPEEMKKIKPFFRLMTRIELRCSQKVAARPGVESLLSADYLGWIGSTAELENDIKTYTEYARFLESKLSSLSGRSISSSEKRLSIEILRRLVNNPVVINKKKKKYLDLALDVARNANAPVRTVVYLSLFRPYEDGKHFKKDLEALYFSDVLKSDATAKAALALHLVDLEKRGSNSAKVIKLLNETINTTELDEKNDLKIGAYIRLASLYQQVGQPKNARTYFERSGLSPNQCAALDSKPKLLTTGRSAKFYPKDLLRAGISGFTLTEYDITAEGHAVNRRTVMGYPPLAFSEASEKIVGQAKFEKSYRPDGGLGCATDENFVRYTTSK